jgi:hypothetical protein
MPPGIDGEQKACRIDDNAREMRLDFGGEIVCLSDRGRPES